LDVLEGAFVCGKSDALWWAFVCGVEDDGEADAFEECVKAPEEFGARCPESDAPGAMSGYMDGLDGDASGELECFVCGECLVNLDGVSDLVELRGGVAHGIEQVLWPTGAFE
jgi:hypothetical protein